MLNIRWIIYLFFFFHVVCRPAVGGEPACFVSTRRKKPVTNNNNSATQWLWNVLSHKNRRKRRNRPAQCFSFFFFSAHPKGSHSGAPKLMTDYSSIRLKWMNNYFYISNFRAQLLVGRFRVNLVFKKNCKCLKRPLFTQMLTSLNKLVRDKCYHLVSTNGRLLYHSKNVF